MNFGTICPELLSMLFRVRNIVMISISVSLLLLFAISTSALMEFDEISEKYCEPENVSEEVMTAIEKCYQLSTINFKGMNPYTECKGQIFTKKETNGEIRVSLCSDEDLDETFEDCMDSAILGHDGFKKLFQDRMDCIKAAFGPK